MALIIALHNISNLAPLSDYEYRVYVNKRLIEQGHVLGHPRAEGWTALVQRLLEQRQVQLSQ